MRAIVGALLSLVATSAWAGSYTYSALTQGRCGRSDTLSELYTTCSNNSDCGTAGLCVNGYIRNPERGFHDKNNWAVIGGTGERDDAITEYNRGRTLVYDRFDIIDQQTVNGTLTCVDFNTASWRNNIKARMCDLRGTGAKAILRAKYDNNCPQTKSRVLADINSILGAVVECGDTLAWLEAGFVGHFGEWHNWSTIDTGLNATGDANVTEIGGAILDKLATMPSSLGSPRMMAWRYPKHTSMMLDTTPTSGGNETRSKTSHVTAANAYTNTYPARIGHHNDCPGYDAVDRGTYLNFSSSCSGSKVDCCSTNQDCNDRYFLANQTDYTFSGGEACSWSGYSATGDHNPNAYIDCDYSLPQFIRNNWTDMEDTPSWAEGQKSLDFWQADGCMDEMVKYFGYYYVLTASTLPDSCQAGGSCQFSFTLRNDGMARMINQRTAYITIHQTSSGTRRNIPLAVDFRKAFPPGGAATGTPVVTTETVTIPGGIPDGTYTVALYLPDFSPELRHTSNGGTLTDLAEEVRGNIQVANSGTWDSTYGYNVLGTMTIGSVDECDQDSDCPEDSNVCTDATCFNPAASNSTCGYTNNTDVCTDGLYCNGTDVCFNGSCSAHSGSPCSDPTPLCNESTDICEAAPCVTNSDCAENPDNPCTTDVCVSGVTWPPFVGRIAISSDGNKHDCDDIFSAAVHTGLIAKSGNASKLVYFGYADHHWDSAGTCTSYVDDDRETALDLFSQDYAESWNAILEQDFDLTVFKNCQEDEAGNNCTGACEICQEALEYQMELSTAESPLYVLGAGPMDIIGRSLYEASLGAQANALQYVRVISHSTWNDNHSDVLEGGETPTHSGWTWSEMVAAFPQVTFIHLPDQNSGFNTDYSSYHVWRDSSDPLLNTLWTAANSTGLAKADCSDSGMTHWLLMGQSTTDQKVTPDELKAAFEPAAGCQNNPNSASCDDGLYCNGADSCSGGACTQHGGNPCGVGEICVEASDTCGTIACSNAGDCADSNGCTTDTCVNPGTVSSYCTNTPNSAACTDGLYCNGTDTCAGGTCSVHAGNPCSAGEQCLEATDECVIDECDVAADCQESPTDNPCTTDTCVNASAANSTCQRTNNSASCDDGEFCNGVDTCQTGTCSVHAGNPCPTNFTCNESTDTCEGECSTNADCTETPDEACTTDVCNAGTCERTNNTDACDDSTYCNGTDTCASGTCSTHAGDPCTGTDVCEEFDDVCAAFAPRVDNSNVTSRCIATPTNQITMPVTIGALDSPGLAVFVVARGAGCQGATWASGASATFNARSLALLYGTNAAPPGETCSLAFFLKRPSQGTYGLTITLDDVVSTAYAVAVPVYNVGNADGAPDGAPESWVALQGWHSSGSSWGGTFSYASSPTYDNTLTLSVIGVAGATSITESGTDHILRDQITCGSPPLTAAFSTVQMDTAASLPITYTAPETGVYPGYSAAGLITSVQYASTTTTTTTTTVTTTTLPSGPGGGKVKMECSCEIK